MLFSVRRGGSSQASSAPETGRHGEDTGTGTKPSRYLSGPRRSGLERFAAENGKRSGGLKTTFFRRNDGGAAFEMEQFQKQNALKLIRFRNLFPHDPGKKLLALLRRKFPALSA